MRCSELIILSVIVGIAFAADYLSMRKTGDCVWVIVPALILDIVILIVMRS